ncbi:PREDICTED: ATP-dependent RNA helicase DED1-like [Diuraphis noxia]|uniref:ATP-dependent RNA helicase DED1-like n=1 Tax=Diuraphis noxia TaxID=143948 RepID=UPI000763A986|nr:PREDICTED: ATP-dependent RNA helicase DED1-like [Diuraphis noxia]
MDKKNIVSKISESPIDVGSDCSKPKNCSTATDDYYNKNCGFKNTYFVRKNNINIRVKKRGTNKKTSFEVSDIHKSLLVNISKLKAPTIILKNVLPIIMGGRDLVAITPVGSAKTTGFVIPIMNCLLNNLPEINDEIRRCDPLAIIMVPTKRAVEKVYDFTCRLINDTSIICIPLYDIESTADNKQKIKNGVHVIVTTPESLASFVGAGLVIFTALQYVVFDEVDLILTRGFKPEIEYILNHKTMVSKDKRSTALFSMTMLDDVKQLAKTYLKPNYISLFTIPDSSMYVQCPYPNII